MSFYDDAKAQAHEAWSHHGREPLVRIWCDCSEQAGAVYPSPIGPVLEVLNVTRLNPADVERIKAPGSRRLPEFREVDPFLVDELDEVIIHGTAVAGDTLRAAVTRSLGRTKPERIKIPHGGTALG